MKIRLLVGQYRTDRYQAELAPNVFAAADEFILDENPSYWDGEVAKQKAQVGDEVEAWAEVDIEVPMDALLDALFPARKPIAGTVVPS